MKKWILLLMGTISLCVFAQRNTERRSCFLTPLQSLIKTARDEKQINELAERGIDFNPEVRCGGTPLQLAIRRGNPRIVKILLENNANVTEQVSLRDFPIEGAPEKVPLISFAAYYAPNAQIIKLLIEAGTDVIEKDKNGETVLWYLNQNPVLSNTEIQDILSQKILLTKPPVKKEGKKQKEERENINSKQVQSKPVLLDAEPKIPLPK